MLFIDRELQRFKKAAILLWLSSRPSPAWPGRMVRQLQYDMNPATYA